MAVSMIRSSQVKLGRTDLIDNRICIPKSSIDFRRFIRWPMKSPIQFSLKSSGCISRSMPAKLPGDASACRTVPMPIDRVRLYVGLPLDAVSDSGTINHGRAIGAGLKALKLLGVEGVELPIWWGIAEKEAMGEYDWKAYLALVEIIQKVGLKLHVSLCFHASKEPRIPLPQWISRIGESGTSIFFKDRSGKNYENCLSFAVDEAPVLDGKTPMEVYREFYESFKASFSRFMGSTITGISIGLGPNGELRYPSNHDSKNKNAGEFQCYDKNMLDNLKHHAEKLGNPLWGLSGPHDVPTYGQAPTSNTFFKDHGGSWETPYGDFFLSWYSNQVLSHGDCMLSLASSIFKGLPVRVSGKIPVLHSWYMTRSHPSELTAGFYNTANRDGYKAVAEIFSRNSCEMILPGMDLSDQRQPKGSLSSPEQLLSQIAKSCEAYGVGVSGEANVDSRQGFERIKKNLMGENGFFLNSCAYHRMGADFFSPEHFPSFTEFVRGLNQPELHSDDLLVEKEEVGEALTGKSLQTA